MVKWAETRLLHGTSSFQPVHLSDDGAVAGKGGGS